jgi:hypothetical protein
VTATVERAGSRVRYPGRLLALVLLAGTGLVAWIVLLAVRLPARYVTDHWDVTWVGFDLILLASLTATAWVVVRRPHLTPTAYLVSAVLLVCDAWFDVTTASRPVDTVVSVVLAVAVELPVAGALVWAARRQLRRERPRPVTSTGT